MNGIDASTQKYVKYDKKTRNLFRRGSIILTIVSILIAVLPVQNYFFIPAWMIWITYLATTLNVIISTAFFFALSKRVPRVLSISVCIIQIFFLGVNFFLASNIGYLIYIHYDKIHTHVDFLDSSVIICVCVALFYFVEFWILSSTRLLQRPMNNLKAWFGAAASGVLTFLATIFGLEFVRDCIFPNPAEIADAFGLLIAAAGMLGVSGALLAILYRTTHYKMPK